MAPEILAFSIVILLFSVILHEVMHGYVARMFGDRTAEHMGRLTLNPIPHIDPIGTILLPAILFLTGSPVLFGWAKPVPVNPLNFKDIKKGELWVSAAGIGANLSLALLAAVIYHLLNTFFNQPLLIELLDYTVTINLVLAIFNLIPIPPLDGSKVLITLLPYELARQYQALERYGFIILIFLLIIPLGNSTVIGTILGFGVSLGRSLLGL